MNCEECGSKLLIDAICDNTFYCKECKIFSGDNCMEGKCECGGELKKSSNGSSLLCSNCGRMEEEQEEKRGIEGQADMETSIETPEKLDMPPLKEQAVNFAGSMVDFVKSGFKTCGEEEKERRLEICRGCALFDSESVRCSKCGCALKYKAGIEGEKCPLGLWDKDKN